MAKISKDQSVGNLHPRETLFITGNIASNGGEIILPADGAASLALDLRGTFSGTIEIAGTIDGTNWTPIPVRPVNIASIAYVTVITGTAVGVWVGKAAPYRQIRARCTAYTSGTFIATLVADTAPLDDTLQGLTAPLMVTTTAAAGVAATLTLPAPGAGLRQYVTFVSINRFAAAVLTAAAAPVVVTTTNMPGALAFSLPADAAAQGTIYPLREDFAYPIAAAAQNTAVTFVAPLTTGVIWRLTVGYYNAP